MEERRDRYTGIRWLLMCCGLETSHLQSIDYLSLPVHLLHPFNNSRAAWTNGCGDVRPVVHSSDGADYNFTMVSEVVNL